MLQAEAIRTPIYSKDINFSEFLVENLRDKLTDGKILAVTSKTVSLAEGRIVSKEKTEKKDLVEKEADLYLGVGAYDCHLTIKQGLLIPSAGIDESNSENGDYILYPKDPFVSAKNIQVLLKRELKLKNLGVILTDSHTSPLRKGVTGVSLSYYGFRGVIDRIGSTDLFGREMLMTQINVADALAVSATLLMGEGDESCPLAILDYPVEFVNLPNNHEIKISIESDIYRPLFEPFL